jgi:hypothetical protein
VGKVSQFCQNPGYGHWNAVKRIISYLSGTPNHELLFKKGNYIDVIGYSDADFARDVDNRKSTTGYIFLYCGLWWAYSVGEYMSKMYGPLDDRSRIYCLV